MRGVVFDLDGTLVDSRADLVAAVNHTLARLGRTPLPFDTVVGYVGEGARRLVEKALAATDPGAVDEGLSIFRAYYGAHLLDRTRAYPGVEEMLIRLAARAVDLCVLSNKPEAMSRAVLAGLGMLDRFVAVVGGDSLPTRKPDPSGLLHLAALRSTAVERLLLVGDSAIDLETARAAGCGFCGALWGFFPDRLLALHPERIVARPLDLVAVVEGGESDGQAGNSS